jgi:hypothetical protein
MRKIIIALIGIYTLLCYKTVSAESVSVTKTVYKETAKILQLSYKNKNIKAVLYRDTFYRKPDILTLNMKCREIAEADIHILQNFIEYYAELTYNGVNIVFKFIKKKEV